MSVLYGILVLALLGLVFGFSLALAAKALKVEEDKRIKDVTNLLPGANCGACGYAGCHDFAEAVVSGKIKNVSRCKVGRKERNFDPIIAYLNAHPDKDGNITKVTL